MPTCYDTERHIYNVEECSHGLTQLLLKPINDRQNTTSHFSFFCSYTVEQQGAPTHYLAFVTEENQRNADPEL